LADPREMIDCKHAHELLSRQMDAPLEPAEVVRLKVHLAICDFCVQVARQFQTMRDAMRRLGL